MEACDVRLEGLGAQLRALGDDSVSGDAWTAREVLAHLALVSKLYGVIAYRVATGKETRYDLLGLVRLRDVAGEKAARQPVQEHLDAIRQDHERTLSFLRGASIADLERAADSGIEGLALTAIDVIRLALVNHCEQHLDQLEAALD